MNHIPAIMNGFIIFQIPIEMILRMSDNLMEVNLIGDDWREQ